MASNPKAARRDRENPSRAISKARPFPMQTTKDDSTSYGCSERDYARRIDEITELLRLALSLGAITADEIDPTYDHRSDWERARWIDAIADLCRLVYSE